jgi:hypothetical protein
MGRGWWSEPHGVVDLSKCSLWAQIFDRIIRSFMTYIGRIKGGVVVFDGEQKPGEGTVVRIETLESTDKAVAGGNRLMKWAGRIDGLPADSSVQLDHYLYGHPKK